VVIGAEVGVGAGAAEGAVVASPAEDGVVTGPEAGAGVSGVPATAPGVAPLAVSALLLVAGMACVPGGVSIGLLISFSVTPSSPLR
jgi:hypothetical protein